MATTELTITANIDGLRRQLESIKDITADQATAMATQLNKLGLVKFTSITSSGAAALIRTATNGKIEWRKSFEELKAGADSLVTMTCLAQGHLSPPHWLSPPFVAVLAAAARGDLGIKGESGPAAGLAALKAVRQAQALVNHGADPKLQKIAKLAIE